MRRTWKKNARRLRDNSDEWDVNTFGHCLQLYLTPPCLAAMCSLMMTFEANNFMHSGHSWWGSMLETRLILSPRRWLPRWSTLGLKMILQLFSFSADRANKWVILFENLKLLLSSSMYIDCFFPGVQRAGPTDATRRCGRADVLLSGVLRREGQPRRGLVLPWLILVSNPIAELVKPMTYYHVRGRHYYWSLKAFSLTETTERLRHTQYSSQITK